MPITIDCSSAMISPATCWSSSGVRPQRVPPVVVEVVEDVRREREQDAEEADEDLRRGHVEHRAEAAEPQPRADRRRAGATSTGARRRRSVRCSSTWTNEWLERGLVERRDVPHPHRADVGDDAERRVPERPGRALEPLDAARRRAAGCAWSAPASGRSARGRRAAGAGPCAPTRAARRAGRPARPARRTGSTMPVQPQHELARPGAARAPPSAREIRQRQT